MQWTGTTGEDLYKVPSSDHWEMVIREVYLACIKNSYKEKENKAHWSLREMFLKEWNALHNADVQYIQEKLCRKEKKTENIL